MRIAAAFRRLEGLPLEVTYVEIQGDNLEEHLERYVKWMATEGASFSFQPGKQQKIEGPSENGNMQSN
jgi:hypothetical protein